MRKITLLLVALAALALSATAAIAAVTFDPATGTGFVGKGDIQTAYGWNNKVLQTNLEGKTFSFRASTVSEATWTCSKPNPGQPDRDIVQDRATTTTTQGVGSVASRVKNQITGFNLLGYTGSPTVTSDKPVGSCPAEPSGFTFDEGSLQETPGVTVLEVSIDNGSTWVKLS